DRIDRVPLQVGRGRDPDAAQAELVVHADVGVGVVEVIVPGHQQRGRAEVVAQRVPGADGDVELVEVRVVQGQGDVQVVDREEVGIDAGEVQGLGEPRRGGGVGQIDAVGVAALGRLDDAVAVLLVAGAGVGEDGGPGGGRAEHAAVGLAGVGHEAV